MDIVNNKAVRNTITNINKIEQIIKMWKVIKLTASKRTNSSIQTFDIPTDSSIPWNSINGIENAVFKTIDNPTLIEELILDRNSHHLNQAQGSPFTVEPLQFLTGTDSDTPFTEALLNGDANLHHISLTKVTKRNLESLTRNKEIIKFSQQQTIPLDEYKKGFRNWKEKTTTSPSGRHLGHHHSLQTPDGVQYSKEKEDFSKRASKARDFLKDKYRWNNRTIDSIEWDIASSFISKQTYATRKTMTKYSHR